MVPLVKLPMVPLGETRTEPMSVNDMWVSFQLKVIVSIERFLPTNGPRQNKVYHGSIVRSDAT